MAATGNVSLEQEIGDRNECPVAAGQHLYRGSMAFGDAAGRATTVLGGKFLGHVVAEADNSNGGAGDINVVLYGGRYRLQVPLTGVALTSIGSQVFASDDNTLTLTPGSNTMVGRVVRYVSTGVAIVEFGSVNYSLVTVVQQPVIAATKANYTAGDTGTAADIATALNTVAAAHNALLAALKTAAVIASS